MLGRHGDDPNGDAGRALRSIHVPEDEVLAIPSGKGRTVNVRRSVLVMLLGAASMLAAAPAAGAATPGTQCAPGAAYPAASSPVAYWSTEARCAIVPPGPGGAFGPENFGNKFPGEAAVYMGIVHAAIFDAAVALKGHYRPYAPIPVAPADTSPAAAIASAAYATLTGLQPQLGASQAILDADYVSYLASIPDGSPKADGIAVGEAVAGAVIALRTDDGRGCTTTLAQLGQPAPAPGVWQPGAGAALGLCLPGMRPLVMRAPSQFRPGAPDAITSAAYADNLNLTEELGRADSTSRTPEQTDQALFWTDHDIRQWNDGLLRLAAAQHLDLLQTARMLAMAHVAGGDAMIACFDAKYHYWFWRPYQAIPNAGLDGNPATVAEFDLGAARHDPELPRVPVGARLPQRRRRRRPARVLRDGQGRHHAGQPSARRDRSDPHLPPAPRRGQGCRLGARPGRLPLPQLRPGGLAPGPGGRTVRGRTRVPAHALNGTHAGEAAALRAASLTRVRFRSAALRCSS